MTSARSLLTLVLGCSIIAACQRTAGSPTATAAPWPSAAAADQDSISTVNDRFAAAVLKSIAGRENQPAESVFSNVTIMKRARAQIFVTIMKDGYARALGVKCTYCHVDGDFASDEKRPKRAAREMAVMHGMINQELAKMVNLATPPTQNRSINCITCHRGVVNPMATSR
jgi:hypothetical protein